MDGTVGGVQIVLLEPTAGHETVLIGHFNRRAIVTILWEEVEGIPTLVGLLDSTAALETVQVDH